MRKKNRHRKSADVSQLMNEVGRELGVDETTRRAPGGPLNFAQRLKQAIRKRAR